MKIIDNPSKVQIKELVKRPMMFDKEAEGKVEEILLSIRERKDEALLEISEKIDKYKKKTFLVTEEEKEKAKKEIDNKLKVSIEQAYDNIYKFHNENVIKSEKIVETMSNVYCNYKTMPIEKIGLYIPGGKTPLFSTLLMLGIPSKIAKCEDIIICSPPNEKGEISSIILYVAELLGIKRIYKIGGAQAIGAMAFGTEQIPKVYKIFGPGNKYVTIAKQKVQNMSLTAIDMPAGPSEVLVMADESCNTDYVAYDLISQAEHDTSSQVVLVSNRKEITKEIIEKVVKYATKLSRKEIIEGSLKNALFLTFDKEHEAIDFINEYAPEHLILSIKDAENFVEKHLKNAGSVFIGNYSPEAVGDYASGTNHTLPTNGYSKMYSGISVSSFQKTISVQKLTKKGLEDISKTVMTMAEAEGLDGHKMAVKIRLN